tara:strand:- start:894 stop:1172 length:279 start_codon:yes stop_codon:yes gene_type:complete
MILAIGDIERAKYDLQKKGITNPTNEEIAMQFVRNHRTDLLKNSDWMAGSDVKMNDQWRNHRQALRDLPANSSPSLDNDNNLTGVVWPSEPT